MDLFDARGNTWLAMVCRFSGYAWLAKLMSSEVLARACACTACHFSKMSRHVRAPLARRREPDRRFSSLHVDLVGSLPVSEGMKNVFTIIDRYSRWVEAIPLPSMTA